MPELPEDVKKADFSPFEDGGIDHDVYVVGVGSLKPALVLMHELPGLTPQCIDLAQRLRDAGFVVYLPLLFGEPSKRGMAINTLRLCINREFMRFSSRADFPIATWLRALGREVSKAHGDRPIGVIGMCLTGGFVLSMIADAHVLAGVSCQPSYPMVFPRTDSRSLAATSESTGNERCRVLGLRFENDRISRPERFDLMKVRLGDRFEAHTLPSDTRWIKRSAHSVLTEEYEPWPGHPTREAYDKVVCFLRAQLG
jgi:dienelactone hydrolase